MAITSLRVKAEVLSMAFKVYTASCSHPTPLNASSVIPPSLFSCHIDLLAAFWKRSHLRTFALTVVSVSNALFSDIHVAQSSPLILPECYFIREPSLNTFRIALIYLTLPLYPALFYFFSEQLPTSETLYEYIHLTIICFLHICSGM